MTGPPQRIGAYEVGCEIGRGGMGVVYRARDSRLGRDVAIKALPEEWVRDEARLERFLQEARALAQLRSPHIAAIYHLEEDGGGRYLILEFVEGSSLAQRLLSGPLPVRQALSWARQTALALEAAHARRIVHRDLKPANIMITPEDQVLVLDFGLAKLVPAAGADSEATTKLGVASEIGEVLGTPGYMSPEQVRGEVVDQRADIWAFGCVLYECLTGHRAFPGRSHHDAASAVLRDEPDFSRVSHVVPPRIRDLLRRCLTKDLDRRLRDIGDARIEIEDALTPPAGDGGELHAATPTNLPGDLTSFIGRHIERGAVAALLKEHRVVTLHGPGGSGKTRLGLQVARGEMERFPDGVWLVELAGLSDRALLAHTTAGAVGVRDAGGDPVKALVEHLNEQRALVVLDNCEHLVAECAGLVEAILRGCSEVSIIATSREPLRVSGEQCFEVQAMDLPAEGARRAEDVAGHEAAQLFLERGRLVRRGFSISESNAAVISQICRRLEGIPLAIELAAARLRALPPQEILSRLSECLDLLSRGPRGGGDRHRTLRATVGWSYELLTPSEQRLFRRLSVFRGGWTLEAAEAVGGDAEEPVVDLLEALVEKSLVVLDERDSHRPRYGMLEIIRQYGESRFGDAEERRQARLAHLRWCLQQAISAESDLSAGLNQQQWLTIVAAEHDNIRAALEFGFGEEATVEQALRIVVALVNFWYLRGHLSEGRRWLAQRADRFGAVDPGVRAKAHLSAGVLAWGQGDHAIARAEYLASHALWEQLGDRERCAAVLTNLGMAHFEAERDCVRARECLEESRRIYQSLGRAHRVPMVQLNLAAVCLAEGRLDEANALLDQCLRAFEQSGDQHRLGFTHFNRAKSARLQGRRAEALDSCGRAAAIAEQLGSEALLAPTLGVTAAIAFDAGHTEVALRLCTAAQQAYRRLGAAGPEDDIADMFAAILKSARAELGSATVDSAWDCMKDASPGEVFRAARTELATSLGCGPGETP